MINSGKMTTIARPYVAAAFEYASENHAAQEWEEMLKAAAMVTNDKRVKQLLSRPDIDDQQLTSFFTDILKPLLDTHKTNFIRLLAENNRLSALPSIYELFAKERAEQEKRLAVEVVSAQALDDAYKQKLSKALTRHFQKQVELDCKVDPSLLGGVLVRAGDTVIDGTIRGKLNRLTEYI